MPDTALVGRRARCLRLVERPRPDHGRSLHRSDAAEWTAVAGKVADDLNDVIIANQAREAEVRPQSCSRQAVRTVAKRSRSRMPERLQR
jgi:hypothetical protein